MSNQTAQAYQSYLKCKWVFSKSGQLPRESFPHSEHQEQLSEKRTEASPPLALDRTAGQPNPILDMQTRRSYGSLPNPLSWATLPTVQVKTSPKEALLLEANLSRELWFKVWFEQNRYQGSRFSPNHIPSGKQWQYSPEKTEKKMLRTHHLNPGCSTDMHVLAVSRLWTLLQLSRPPTWIQIHIQTSLLCDFVLVT